MILWRWCKPLKFYIILLLAGGVFTTSPVVFSDTPGAYISEVVAQNKNGLQDEDGMFSDWIELHNPETVSVSLEGWSLSDKNELPRKWFFPQVFLEANEYLVVFASGKNRKEPGSLHTNFQLDRDGESLGLYNPEGILVSMPGGADGYPEQEAGPSYSFDTGKERYVFTPKTTPGQLNDLREWYWGRLAPPLFSKKHGLYKEDFLLDIKTPDKNARVVYSLDASIPSMQDGIFFDNALTVSTTSMFRAVSVAEHWLPSRPATQTYIFPEHIEKQEAPSRYPDSWGDESPADYRIRSLVSDKSDPKYTIQSALMALPTLSLVFDVPDFFNIDTGIYMNTLKDGIDWERPISVEMFGNEELGFTLDAGLRIQGRSSRQPQTTPKHSFRLLFKRTYGPDQLSYPLFGDKAAQAFDTLVLRATSNHSWLYPLAEQREQAQYLRDPWAKATQRDMGHTAPHTRFVHLYLNGLYWGLYNISERPDDQFMAAYFGGDNSDYDVYKGGETLAGSPRAWRHVFAVAESSLSDDEKYNALDALVNMDSFIDFIILNHFIGNETWDYGNWYAALNRVESGKFHFFVWDTETSMNRVSENSTFTRNNGRPTALFHILRKIPEFQRLFEERLSIHCTNGGVLTPESNSKRYESLATEIDLAIVAESARWGDYRLNISPHRTGPYEHYTRENHWLMEQKRLLSEYFPNRTGILLDQYKALGLWPE